VTPEWRQRLARRQRRMLTQAGHRLVVSPWFAAGAGVVIATGVMIYTPHAKLNFGNAIQVTPCTQASCTQTAPAQAPGLPAGGGVTAPPASLPKGMTFWYQPGHSIGDQFSMWIEIRARDSLGQWKLSFSVPGAQGIYVYWPRWTSSGNSVTVNSNYASTESAGFAEISAHQSGVAGGLSLNGSTILFQIRGTGAPNAPTICTYNGATCHFKLSSALAQAGGQGSG
jgi:hypothetical protein